MNRKRKATPRSVHRNNNNWCNRSKSTQFYFFPIIIIASTQIILSCHLDRHTVSSRQAYLSPIPQGARPGFCGAVGQWDFVLHRYRQATQCLLATSTLVSVKVGCNHTSRSIDYQINRSHRSIPTALIAPGDHRAKHDSPEARRMAATSG